MTAVVVLIWGGVVLSACGDPAEAEPIRDSGASVPAPTGYETPSETVAGLLGVLAAGNWEEAALMTAEGQMALVALAEGADIETVSDYLRLGEAGVGANFWSGFAQVAEEYLGGPLTDLQVLSDRAYQAGDRSFVDFSLARPGSPEDRAFRLTVVRSGDALWRVDVIATFTDVLAYRLSETAEIARATRTEDAGVVAAELDRQVPSLQAALTDPDLSPEARQGIQSALTAIG